MTNVTLKSLHAHLRLLENASDLKRRLLTSSNPRTLKEGLYELSRLIRVDESVFKDHQTVAALIGAQRFVMIWGEPSVSDQVARVFDNTRVLLSGLVADVNLKNAAAGHAEAGPQQGGAMAALQPGTAQGKGEILRAPAEGDREAPLNDLRSLLSGNAPLTCRLFRALFEHMLAFAVQTSGPQASAALVNELTGSKEHGRSFLSTALFILGAEVDREHLMSFMLQQGLFGMPTFENMLQRRDYCDAFHSFRRLERAFVGSPATEEAHLRSRLDAFTAQLGGKPYGAKIFEADQQDKGRIDAYLAAADVLEAMALTPWCMSLTNAVSVASSNCVRSASTIAIHFERFGRCEITKERANQEIADHLLAFARQFSADAKPA